MLQVCLNGRRTEVDSPHVPVTPKQLAAAAWLAVHRGADDIHLHPKEPDGRDTMDPDVVAEVLTAVRALVDVPVGLTTGAWIDPDPEARIAAIKSWTVLPDHASVNWHEPGAHLVAAALARRGVTVHAGLWSSVPWIRQVAPATVSRVLVEVVEDDPGEAVAVAWRMLRQCELLNLPEVLLHGEGGGAWPVLGLARSLGLDTRIGLEDVLTLPDGTRADNAALVAAALEAPTERWFADDSTMDTPASWSQLCECERWRDGATVCPVHGTTKPEEEAMSGRLKGLHDPAGEWLFGVVTTTDWHRLPWASRLAAGVIGEVRVVSSEEAVGFKVEGGGHANWLALVRGPSGAIHAIPGCKVQAITYGCEYGNEEFIRVP